MNNSRVQITLEAQLYSPLHIAGPGRKIALVDRPIELDSRNFPLIPASSARGRIRVHLERLLKTMNQPVCAPPTPERMCPHCWAETAHAPASFICMACRLFGNPWHYARVVNDDLLFMPEEGEELEPDLLRMERTSLSVSRILGTAQAERLYTTESTTTQSNGRALRFEGLMGGALSDIELGWFLRRGMPSGQRIPGVAGGTYGTELFTTAEGADRLRRALQRLTSNEPAKFDSPALGPMSHADRIRLNLRHAELHLGFLVY